VSPGRRRTSVAAAVAAGWLALLGAERYAAGWTIDNRVEVWADRGVAARGYALARERFGGDEFVVARIEAGPELGLEEAPAVLADLAAGLADLPGVRASVDPFTLPGLPGGSPAERLDAARGRHAARALDLVGDGPRVDVLLAVDPAAEPARRAELVAGLERARARARELGASLRVAGHPLVVQALDVQAARVERVFGPWLVALGALVVALVLRSLPTALVVLLPALLAASGIRAGLRAVGLSSNMMLVAAGPLVFVLTVASLLHQALAFRRHLLAGLPPLPAARRARAEVFGTSLLAAITTVAGFGVFAFSRVEAVRELGIAVAAVLLLVLPLGHLVLAEVLAVLPAAWLPRGDRAAAAASPGQSGEIWRRLAALALRYRAGVVAAAAAACLLGAAAPFALRFGTDALAYFPDGHALREEFLGLERDGARLSGIDVLVRRGDAPAERSTPAELAALSRALAEAPGAAVFGPDDVQADLAQVAGPLAPRLLPEALRAAGRLDEAGEWLRWSVRLPTPDADGLAAARRVLERAAGRWAEERGGEAVVTGSLALVLGMQERLVGTLITALSWNALVAFAGFLLVVRGPREWLAAVLVNVFPVACVFAAAFALGFAMDAATVMVGSVVMGLAVDNTFHLLRAGGSRGLRGRLDAFARVGDAAATSTLAMVVGFGALALSSFEPTARFGLLCTIGVAAAFVGDFVVLPAIWPSGRPRRATAGAAAWASSEV